MYYKKVGIAGFGGIQNKEIEFKHGINLVYGKNESGKTTTQEFIKYIMYGTCKRITKKDIIYASVADLNKYKNSKLSNLGGVLVCIDSEGNEYQVIKKFKGNRLEQGIFKNGTRVDSDFSLNKTTKTFEFAEKMLGLNCSCFESLSIVKQCDADGTLNSAVKDNISNLASNSASIDIQPVLDTLTGLINEHTPTTRSTRRLISQVQLKINAIESAIMDIDRVKNTNIGLIAEIKCIEDDIVSLDNQIEKTENTIKYIGLKRRFNSLRDARLRAIDNKSNIKACQSISEELAGLSKYSDVDLAELAGKLGELKMYVSIIETEESSIESLDAYRHEIESLSKEIENKSNQLIGKENLTNKTIERIKELETELSSIEKQIDEIHTKRCRLNKKMLYFSALSVSALVGFMVNTGVGLVALSVSLIPLLLTLKMKLSDVSDMKLGSLTERSKMILDSLRSISMEYNVEYKVGSVSTLESIQEDINKARNIIKDNKSKIEYINNIYSQDKYESSLRQHNENICKRDTLIEYFNNIKCNTESKASGLEDLIEELTHKKSKYNKLKSELSGLRHTDEDVLEYSEDELTLKMAHIDAEMSSLKPLIDLEMDDMGLDEATMSLADRKVSQVEHKNSLISRADQLKYQIRNEGAEDSKLDILENKLGILKKEFNELTYKRTVYENCKSRIIQAQNRFAVMYLPTIKDSCLDIISAVTDNRYTNIEISRDMEVSLVDSEGSVVDNMSKGTKDLINIAIRCAVLQYTRDKVEESVPIIIDEAFANIDNTRMPHIVKCLSDMCKDTQIIVLTCKSSDKQVFDQCLGDNYNYVEI